MRRGAGVKGQAGDPSRPPTSPIAGRVLGSVLLGGPEEVEAAVEAAEAAAAPWGKMAAEERALRLER